MSDFNALDYTLALSSFKLVIKDDSKDYTIAVDKIKQCVKKEDDSEIKQAQDSASKDDYATAIQCVNDALAIDGSNQQLNLSTKYSDEQG